MHANNINLSQRTTFVFRLALLSALIAITYFATTPKDLPVVSSINDNVNHALAFYALSLFLDFSFPQNKFGLGKIVALLTYGAFIEVIQYFIPHRNSSALDLVADGVGIMVYGCSIPLLKQVFFFQARWNREN